MEKQISDNGRTLSIQQKKYLAIIIPVVVIIMSLISYLRYINFYTSNWDLGIEMQMLGDNFHGYLLFEAGDFETYGVLSHLEIHSTYIALPFSVAYQELREPIFLFVSQAIFFSISLLPLNAISRHYGLSDRQSLFVTILYVTNVGFIASQMYDFHWMSLIPVEILTLFFMVERRRYVASATIIILGAMTLEVFPLLTLGVLLYFYYEDIISKGNIRKNYLSARGRLLLLLSVLSVSIFFIIKYAQYEIIPSILKNSDVVAIIRSNYPENFYPVSISLFSTGSALLYWAILYASLGLIPLFYRRHLLIALPWLYESILVVPQYATIQDQYGFIALPPLFIGLILGIGTGNREQIRLARMIKTAFYSILTCLPAVLLYESTYYYNSNIRIFLSVLAALIMLIAILAFDSSAVFKTFQRKHKRAMKHAIGIVLILLLVFNFLTGPLNPSNEEKTVDSGYAFSYSVNPEYKDMLKITSLVPENASIIASDNLFPYISSNPNAFSFYWNSPENLSFFIYDNLSVNFSFTFVLIDKSQINYIPRGVLTRIKQSYGLLSVLYSNQNYPGDIWLYKAHYHGKVKVYSG
jgi:uncharacterized membrane protein